MGKTELAITYAHAFAGEYGGGQFYISAENRDSVRDVVVHELARALPVTASPNKGSKHQSTYGATILELQERIRESGPILVVLDNVTNPQLLSAAELDNLLVVGEQLHVLATTRFQSGGKAGYPVNWLVVREFDDDEGLELLNKYRPFAGKKETEAALTIVRRLGGYPLAIELVAAWLELHSTITYASYVRRMGLNELRELSDLGDDKNLELRRHNHERRLAHILTDVLNGLNASERRFLEYAAFFHPNRIPIVWLRALSGAPWWVPLCVFVVPHAAVRRLLIDDEPMADASGILDRLARLALIHHAPADPLNSMRGVVIHPLVQSVVITEMNAVTRIVRQRTCDGFLMGRQRRLEESEEWQRDAWEIEPLATNSQHWASRWPISAARLLTNSAKIWIYEGEWRRAKTCAQNAIELYGKVGDPDEDQNLIVAYVALGRASDGLGLDREAENATRAALAIVEHGDPWAERQRSYVLARLTSLIVETAPIEEVKTMLLEAWRATSRCDVERRIELCQITARLRMRLKQPQRAETLLRTAIRLGSIDKTALAESMRELAKSIVRPDERCWCCGKHMETDEPLPSSCANEAERLLRHAMLLDERFYGAHHIEVLRGAWLLQRLLRWQERWGELVVLAARSLSVYITRMESAKDIDTHEVSEWLYFYTQAVSHSSPSRQQADNAVDKLCAPFQTEIGTKFKEIARGMLDEINAGEKEKSE